MSLVEACGWTCLRSLAISILAVAICTRFASILSRGGSRLVWLGFLSPLLCPEILTGYAYSSFSLSLIQHPVWKELWYSLLVAFRWIPAGTLMALVAPSPSVSREAIHCYRLAKRPDDARGRHALGLAAMWLRRGATGTLPIFAIVFLLSFQEFEMASLFGATSWTVWLFDAQASGLMLTNSLASAVWPLACELVVLIPVWYFALHHAGPLTAATEFNARPTQSQRVALNLWVMLSVMALWLIPMWIVGRDGPTGIRSLFGAPLMREAFVRGVAGSLLVGITAMAITYVGCQWLWNRHRWRGFAIALCLPGFLGILLLSLILLFLFQSAGLNWLYNSPVPLVTALVLWMSPRALLLLLLTSRLLPSDSIHSANLLFAVADSPQRGKGRELWWQTVARGHVWALFLLFLWAYLDLTATSILAPAGFRSAPIELYIQTHYGRNAVLSVMIGITVAVPALVLGMVVASRQTLIRWFIK